ncbi:MAG: hypothetical protein LBL34_04800 [Clostridiales bacterium]|jgi:hypothetical protein|nr:hypothetical protein [Clostridiales bacterium]
MAEFQTIEIMKPLTDFLKTCPFLDKYHVSMANIDTQKFSTDDEERSALEFTGSTQTDRTTYVNGDVSVVRQANFHLLLKRLSGDNEYRTETSEFLHNFERWIDWCEAYGLTPNFGDDPITEKMWADNGVYIDEWEDARDVNLYMIQLHILYTENFKEE